jgi:exodeoxyribonuclease VII large subunit
MKIFSIEELNSTLKGLIVNHFSYPITVKGEISNASKPINGHQYFKLSDESGFSKHSIKCMIWKGTSQQIVREYESQEVLVTGKVTMYEATGESQIQVTEIKEYGEGALKKAIEDTRIKLEKEGLFQHKKLLPQYPGKIGLITSPDSHALHDVCSKLKSRFPISNIIIYPSLVQGKYAPENIIKQIIRCNEDRNVDIILLIRGGGSLEDLMAFNDEKLARSIYASKLPIVTGIGHQPDITIADYVADVSMETPTAAAVHITPDQFELLQRINDVEEQIRNTTQLNIKNKKEVLVGNIMQIQNYNPSRMLNNFKDIRENIDTKYHNIMNIVINELTAKSEYQLLRMRQAKNALTERITISTRLQKNITEGMNQKIVNLLNKQINTCKTLTNELLLSNPLEILKKGYSIIRNSKGEIVESKYDLDKIQSFSAEFQDGVARIKKPISIK